MLQDDKEFYKVCFDNLSVGICITDNKGVIIMNNASLEEIFAYEKGELLHQSIDTLIPNNYRSSHENHLKAYFQNPKKYKMGNGRDLYGLQKTGKVIPIGIGLSAMEYEGQTYAKALISDISSRKKEEFRIKELNLVLEREVTQQTHELTLAVTQLKRSNKKLKEEVQKKIQAENKAKKAFKKEKELNLLQTKFLSLASHEFKTPLSGIMTSTTLIDKYTKSGQHSNTESHIKKIKKLVNQLNSVLDDFLFLDKTETKKVNYQFTDFSFFEFFNQVVKNSKTVLKQGQQIEYTPSNENIEVYQDKIILDIIFRNILYNAIKYSPKDSLIKIEVKANAYISVLIEDNGIGIPEEDQKHVFDRFFRARNALHFQGTGIGLNIVKHHIVALGGSIDLQSVENIGTTVLVKLPVRMKG